MRGKTPVFVYAADPVSAAGAKAQLMNEPSIELLGPVDIDRARVAVLIADAVDSSIAKVVRAIQRDRAPKVLLVAGRFDQEGVVAATAAGVTSFLRKSEATTVRLTGAIHDADECGCHLPEGLMRMAAAVRVRAVDQADAINVVDPAWNDSLADAGMPSVSTLRLSSRESEVLRLVADGFDTTEISDKLGFSESTIKGILAKLMTRLEARNRCHTVAIAVRRGLI